MASSTNTDDMKTLASCLNKIVKDGYGENFKVTDEGLQSLETEKIYKPEQVHIVNFFRFEGQTDPGDSSILYVLETTDGTKGTLVDAYGPEADADKTIFIREVENIEKKKTK